MGFDHLSHLKVGPESYLDLASVGMLELQRTHHDECIIIYQPVIVRPTSLSTTSITASSFRRYFSVRHSLASSTHARVNWPA